ncbi:hypothetical protein ACT8ZV_19925 [Nocardioides sp. MAHUQ-72]|uniref:hypothetical protein n=1 Tax=unclassified Nocardioides TaxID=2615069 RepID=UPI00360DF281
MRPVVALTGAVLALGAALGAAPPALAHGDHGGPRPAQAVLAGGSGGGLLASPNVAHLSSNPSQVGISGCFMRTAPILVTSGVDSVRVWDVSDAAHPSVIGVLPNALFENEAMNCGERRTADGVRRFALIGVDSVQASPGDVQHANVGGGELIVVDVTDPRDPVIASRAPGTTSTHTVACVTSANCTYAYSAGEGDHFSIFDLRDLDHPREVDATPGEPGTQPFWSPTAGHKWNFDAAGIGTHTGWNGASMWRTDRPAHPRLITTTGRAGRGTDPRHPGWNDFILHNSFRPHAKAFRPGAKPSFAHGNVLLTTEEDYEQTDCSRAGSFQTWWVKRLDGTRSAIVPLDKVELADLGTFPLPRGAFCSSHWFDFRPGGIVAVGYYGGGTQLVDARHPRHLRSYGHAVWGASEVWDSMWVPAYDARGRQTGQKTNVVYSIDLVRGLDVYAVDVPGDGVGAEPEPGSVPSSSTADRAREGAVPLGLVGGAVALALAARRRTRRR